MKKKYKLSDLAKDLKVVAKDLVENLKKYLDKPIKTTTTLTEEEANIAIELYSQKNQVNDFEEYFILAKEKKINSKSVEEDALKMKEQEELKKEKQEKKEELKQEKKEELKQEKKEKQEKIKSEIEEKIITPKEENFKNFKNKKEKNKKQFKERNERKTLKLTPKEQNNNTKIVQQEEKKNFVDTKAAQVNYEKYDEKYEKLAGEEKIKDSYQSKQKFKRRSNQKNLKKKEKETEAQKLQRLALEKARQQKLRVKIPDNIVVSELALRLKVNVAQVIKQLMSLGVMANANETIDFDTASLVAQELGAKVEHEVTVTIEERLFEEQSDDEGEKTRRDPIVVVVGHVDHGKTSLLDKIRNTNIISSESGGITQHIGAYKVKIKDGKGITFLDTPGHEAFTSMRMRGVNVTDIAILVVAADDGIMPQTVEAINHAKAAKVSIIVAINKIDKPEADIDKIKKELTEHELIPEEWGGDTICVPVSAKTGQGIEQLLEMIDLVAEVKELKAVEKKFAKGTVVEAYLDKGRGPVATLLVQNGTLNVGDSIIAGVCVGRVRVMLNDKGKEVKKAGPSTPVEITGLSQVPNAGDIFNAVANEKLARELVEKRKFIIKADVQGSVEALKNSLEKLSNEEVKISIIHCGSGAINEADVKLAYVSGAIVVGFNVRPNALVKNLAQARGVELRLYTVIYDALEDVEKAMKGMLAPKEREVELGTAEVRQVYKISNVGTIAGCYVTSGKVLRKANVRLVRDGIIIAQDTIKSLKRFKEDAKEVLKEFECGIGLTNFNDIKVGDVLESYIIEEYTE